MNESAAHFAVTIDAGDRIALRPLTHTDMSAIVAMFADPEVARWYNAPPEEIADHIGHAHVWPYLVTRESEPIGYVHVYRANDDEFWQRFGVPRETFGLDMFLMRRGSGIGPRMTRALIDHIWKIPKAVRVQIDPDPANARAVHAYEKSGFTARGVFPGYEPGEDMLYMTIERS